jgi:hypothetical protein
MRFGFAVPAIEMPQKVTHAELSVTQRRNLGGVEFLVSSNNFLFKNHALMVEV